MANAVYTKAGTSVQWTDSTGDLAMTLQNLAAGAGRQGAQKDWGVLTTARETLYHFRLLVQFETAPVVGEQVELYWKSGDGTDYDNDDGTGDIALSSTDKLKNLNLLGILIVDEAAADVDMSIQGYFRDLNQYGMPVVYNNTADNLQNTANVGFVTVTPVFEEIQ